MKIFRCAVFILIIAAFLVMAVSAEQTDEDIYDEQFDLSGAGGLFYNINDDASSLMGQNGIDAVNSDKIMNFSFFDFLKSFWNMIVTSVKAPFVLLASITGIMLLCSLITALKATDSDNSLTTVFSLVSVLAVCGTIIVPVTKCISNAANSVNDAGNFMLSFIPVFTGIVTASGKPFTAAAYDTVLFSLVQIIMRIASTVLVPLLGIYLAFCIIANLNEQMKIMPLAAVIKKVVLWALGILATIFTGLFVIQTFVSSAADNVSTRTAKFLVTSFIPVVGGAISEALNTIGGCLGLLKSTVGAFGVLAIVFTMLPPIISVAMYMLVLNLGSAVGEMLAVEKLPEMLKAAGSALSILLGIMVFVAVLLIVSTTIVISVGGNM